MTDEVIALRPRMMSVAYRMLGSVADAEDAVQDAFMRFHTAGGVSSPEGFLIRTTTRLCIDRLRERKRKEYVGPWVPEPVETRSAAKATALAESLTQAFLLLLERLTPDERAAFLLRTVFDYEYAEIGELLDRSESAVRQLMSRARGRLGLDGDRRFPAAAARADAMAEQFVAACRAGDIEAVEAMLAEDAELHPDGGGKASAARVGHPRASKGGPIPGRGVPQVVDAGLWCGDGQRRAGAGVPVRRRGRGGVVRAGRGQGAGGVHHGQPGQAHPLGDG